MAKVKGTLLLALLLFFIAYNPAGAAATARILGGFAVDLADGLGVVAVSLIGGK